MTEEILSTSLRARMTFVDVCAGIGGFSLGLEWAGMTCKGQVEIDDWCNRVLAKHWPDVPRWGDVKTLDSATLGYADVFTFGDPCPKHSRARSNGASRHPDLAGYCLALVGRLRPRWVVRENVPAPTVAHFAACLEALGYGTVIVRMDSATHTGQSRQRDFIVGCYKASRANLRRVFSQFQDGPGSYTTRLGTREVIPALTTHRTRYDSRDCYVWDEKEQQLRILDSEEREVFAGFPAGWTAGLSESARARMYGNSLDPIHAYELGRCILAAEGKSKMENLDSRRNVHETENQS